MSKNIIHLSDATFETEVLQSTTPVLVDYWAEWCGPCKMIAPILDEISKDYEGKLKIAKLNIDENLEKTKEYGIQSIPSMVLFVDGKAVHTIVGAMPKHRLLKELSEWI